MDAPHFDLPFRFGADGQLATVEQGSTKDVYNKVATLALCPLGFRDELPEFGWPQPVFESTPLDLAQRQALTDEWVPDARAVLSEHGDTVDDAVRTITVNVNPEGA
jgi:hypothetical protein